MASPIIPCLRYADAPAAILFLCDAFGFMPAAIHYDEEDERIVRHAQLAFGSGMVMLASDTADADDPFGWTSPADADGVTQTLYVVVADADAHHARALGHGAEIVTPPHDNDGYPGRSYDARDPEGHVWHFGSYDPAAAPQDA